MNERPKLETEKFRGNPQVTANYLNEAFATGELALIVQAIGDLGRAHGASEFSRKSGLQRKNLYRSFTGKGCRVSTQFFQARTALV